MVRLDDREATDEAVLLSVQSLLADTDAAVWLRGGHAARPGGPLAQDPRVHVGEPPPGVLGRCRYQVVVHHPVALVGTTLRQACRIAPALGDGLRLSRTRDLHRPADAPAAGSWLATRRLDDVDVGRLRGRAARTE